MPAEPGYIGGGMFEREPDFPQGPVITIDVDSIDDVLETIRSLGGEPVGEKMPVGEMGIRCLLQRHRGQRHGPVGDRVLTTGASTSARRAPAAPRA